jgi:hypothetical protein
VRKFNPECTAAYAIRDQQIFRRDHANSLIVVSAYGSWASWVPKGFVGCHAYVGGRGERGQTKGQGRAFLVSAAEYDVRSQHGFVIDPAKYKEIRFPPHTLTEALCQNSQQHRN